MRLMTTRCLFLLISSLTVTVCAEQVSWDPPRLYSQRLAPLLTRADDVLDQRNAFANEDVALTVLLSETIRTVDKAGRVTYATHRICLARNEAGAQRLAREVCSYRKAYQKVHLALARSITSDNQSQPVDRRSAFLQSPQHEAENSVYSDNGELVIIFPQVKPGTITESVIVIEDHTPRMADEFTAQLTLDSWWPQVRVRNIVELPEVLARRLRITPRGQGVPVPQREAADGNRVRWTWLGASVPATQWEPERAPSDQIGPVVYLSTLPDWNRFGNGTQA
jgi:hypothetical protein